jgi:hypothetical protein
MGQKGSIVTTQTIPPNAAALVGYNLWDDCV